MYVASGKNDAVALQRLCEAAYNNRLRVPEHPAIIEGWQQDAAAFRHSADCETGIAYGERERMKLDLFWPHDADRVSCPIAMFIHGGYWQGLDRSYFSHLAHGVNAHGVALALPSYTLCPDVTIGHIIDEIAEACLFLWRRHGRRLAVCGHSAGGHLTAEMLRYDFRLREPTVPADLAVRGVPVSGLFDLRDLRFTSINDKAGMNPADAEAWSALLHNAPTGRVLHSYVGALESDAFLWQSEELVKLWAKSGNDTRHIATRRADRRGDDHFTVVAHLADPASAMTLSLAQLARMGVA